MLVRMSQTQELLHEDVMRLLHIHIRNRYGSVAAFARAYDMQQSFVHRMLSGESPIPDRICKECLNLKRHKQIIYYYTPLETAKLSGV